ncbi:MAG: hypothetical protein COA36_13545 [Desulfotalea sp.]|nr:MAG: hypothetical protein COA36_13545 [Desulfotalea sp.]
MIKRTLRPFIGNEVDAVEGIEYGVWRDAGCICVEYDLYGLLSHLEIPEGAGLEGKRSDELWRHTCFELFVREETGNKTHYLECNFSPAGDWNMYSFSSYREAMEQAKIAAEPKITIEQAKKTLTLRAEVDLTGLVSASSVIDVGVGCIVENKAGKLGYWAVTHPGEKPDFHDPRSFEIRLIGTKTH